MYIYYPILEIVRLNMVDCVNIQVNHLIKVTLMKYLLSNKLSL